MKLCSQSVGIQCSVAYNCQSFWDMTQYHCISSWKYDVILKVILQRTSQLRQHALFLFPNLHIVVATRWLRLPHVSLSKYSSCPSLYSIGVGWWPISMYSDICCYSRPMSPWEALPNQLRVFNVTYFQINGAWLLYHAFSQVYESYTCKVNNTQKIPVFCSISISRNKIKTEATTWCMENLKH